MLNELILLQYVMMGLFLSNPKSCFLLCVGFCVLLAKMYTQIPIYII